MQHLIDDIRYALDNHNWYAALALALAVPEACAAIERPGTGISRARYVAWADARLARYFSDPSGTPFLTGSELYSLRCAYLHQGEMELSDREPQNADNGAAMFEVLNRVTLYVSELDVVPARGMTSTGSRRTTSYSVAVKDLCEWICSAAEDWLADARRDPTMAALIERTSRIVRIETNGEQSTV